MPHAAAFDLDETVGGEIGEAFAYAVEGAGDAALDKTAGLSQSHAENPVDFALPLAESMLGEQGAGFEPALEVIHAKVSGVGVGNIDGDEGNVSLLEDVGHARGDVLLDLELEHEVNAFGDKFLGVPDGNIGVVAVVEDEKLDAGCGGRGSDALGHSDGEGQLRALDRQAEAQAAGARNQPVLAVLGLGDVAAVDEGLEDAINAGLGDPGFPVDVLEGGRGVILLQELEYIEGLGEDGNQVQPLDLSLGQPIVSVGIFQSAAGFISG